MIQDNISNIKKEDNNETRLIEYDLIKCFAIFLVLYGHSFQHLVENGDKNIVFQTISMFHMPLFMVISGFFSRKSLSKPILNLTINKFKQLIYPTISFGLFLLIASNIINYDHNINYSLQSTYIYIIGIFWFLKSLFCCFIILKICIIVIKYKLIGGLISIIISQCIPLYKINWMMPFFVFGFLFSTNLNIFKLYHRKFLYISSIVFILIVSLFYDSIISFDKSIQYIKTELIMGNLYIIPTYLKVQFGRFIIGILGSLISISAIIYILKIININNKFISFIQSFGQETLSIYILQTLLLEMILPNLYHSTDYNIYIFTIVIAPLISIIIMILCVKINKILKCIPLLNKIMWCK